MIDPFVMGPAVPEYDPLKEPPPYPYDSWDECFEDLYYEYDHDDAYLLELEDDCE